MSKRSLFFSVAVTAMLATTAARADGIDVIGPPPAPPSHVNVVSEVSVELLRGDAALGQWVRVCTSPCEADVPADAEYKIRELATGREGKVFRLDPRAQGSVRIRYSAPSTGMKVGGALFLGVAVAAIAGGVAMMKQKDSSSDSIAAQVMRTIGGAVLVALGGGAGTGGALMMALSGPKTKQTPLPARRPSWIGPPPSAPSAPPPSVTVPIELSF